MLTIRQEIPADYATVYRVVREAFATAEHRSGTEQDLLAPLRQGAYFIPELSLVALADSQIVGHILFTKAQLDKETAVLLAPLAVLPPYQRKGVGTSLLQRGHEAARKLGYEFSLVVGSPSYYGRVGYKPAAEYGILPPFEVPSANFMALNLQGNHLTLENIKMQCAPELML